MASIQRKMSELERKMEEKKRLDDTTDFDRAKRELKEEAGKSEVNVDLLHEKLIHLESVARRTNHEMKDKLELILKRFNVHKRQNPTFVGDMVLNQISTKEEESVLNKEQKIYKRFSMGYPGGSGNGLSNWGNGAHQMQAPGPFLTPGQLPTWGMQQAPMPIPQPHVPIPQPQMLDTLKDVPRATKAGAYFYVVR